MNSKKTLLLYVAATVFILGNVVFANYDDDALVKDEPQKVAWLWGKSKDERKDEKALLRKKKEAEKRAQARMRQAKKKSTKLAGGKKCKKKEKKKKPGKAKKLLLAARVDKKAKIKAAPKVKVKDAEKERLAKARKAEKLAAKKAGREKAAAVRADRKAEKRLAKIEQGKIRYGEREPSHEQIDWAVKSWERELARFKEDDEAMRSSLVSNWRNFRKKEVAQEYTDGMYADLYKVPSWPIEATFFDHKSQLNVATKFQYQTSAYSSVGSGHDLSKLYFGEDPIRLRDILLAFKLKQNSVVADNSLLDWLNVKEDPKDIDKEWNQDFDYIGFLAESEEFMKSINYSRYIWGRDVLIGLQIPLGYKKHELKFSSYGYDFSNVRALSLWQRESTFKTVVEKVLELKNLHYNRKNSITGIGDISLFANVEINSRYFEKANWGLRLQLPTSKDADPSKLWAPSLGEEFTKVAGHVAMLWSPRPWINPHLFMQATYAANANVNRRVPKKITHKDSGATSDLTGVMLLGEKVKENGSSTFTEWDTTVPGMADASRKVDVQPGPEIFVRLGNMFEKMLFRRAFLDVYYDFRAKFEDSASGLPEDNYNLRILEQNTHQIEHNLGFNFSYQFDYHTRLQGGGRYTFYGINVPQTFELSCNLGIEF